jgi:predicted secreted protein
MKIYKPALFLFIPILFAIASCKKDAVSGKTLTLTVADSGKTLSVVNGEKILVTLGNPGDGGFTFNAWQYNSAILALDSHTRNYPPANSPVGDFGSDTWQFTAIKNGTSTLKITATQSPVETVTMFNGSIKVQ